MGNTALTRRLRAFTLVELLVVITIIGMLMAILIPAVLAAIEAARKAHCSNNLGQLAIATSGHVMAKDAYPGYFNTIGARTAPWTVAILPFAGRTDVYQAWADATVADADLPRGVIELYQCPSDSSADPTAPQLSYVANAGASSAVAESPANGIFLNGVTGSPHPAGIADGQANTVLLSENIQATQWPNTGRTENGFLWHPTTAPLAEHRVNRGRDLPLSENTARPSSHHRGGVHFAFCDAHVKFVDEQMEYKVYMQLMTSNGAGSDMPTAWKNYVLSDGDY